MKIGRIVAAMHPRRPLGTRIQALAEHARVSDAELVALFVEDIEMLHFAAMPFACEIGSASIRKQSVDVAAVERYMAARAAEMRTAFSQVLDRTSVAWTFRVARGTVLEQLLAAGTERQGPVLLLPPAAQISVAPIVIARSQLLDSKLQLQFDKPILLLDN